MKKIFVCLLGMLYGIVSGQESIVVIPPSPEAASLGKFVESPVSYYNGTPSIQVPIHTASLDGMSIPIQLSYHAKGVQVAEVASRVGLGWSLNAGGVITRQIRDAADEYIANSVKGCLRDNYYETFFTSEQTRRRVQAASILQELDFIPDIFMFNFMGYTGKFFFDQRTKQPVIQSFSDITIQPIWETGSVGPIKGWKVQTPDGYTYHFGTALDGKTNAIDKEVVTKQGTYNTRLSTTPGSGFSPNMAWYLMDIVSPNGRSAKFSYTKETPRYVRRSFDKIDKGPAGVTSYFSEVRPIQHQVAGITFPEGSMTFIPSTTEREDIQGAYTLETIQLKNTAGTVIKSFGFKYTYTNNISNSNTLEALLILDPRATKRLFLDSITTYDQKGENNIPPYTFAYHSEPLPNRFSNSQDAWGYYNGKQNGDFLTFKQAGARTEDRSVDETKNKAGLLTQITYPTGGTATYEYEANLAVKPPYFDELLTPETAPYELKTETLAKSPLFYNGRFYESEEPFEIIYYDSDDVNVSLFINPSEFCDSEVFTTTCPYKVQLLNEERTIDFLPGRNVYRIPRGTYTLRATPRNVGAEDPKDFETSHFAIALTWKIRKEIIDSGEDTNNLLYTAGNRIKKITLNDGANGNIIKEYEYKKPNGQSSGLVFAPPIYYYIDDIVGNNTILIRRVYGARPGSPMSYEQGNHEGYSHVTEYQVANGERMGKTEYSFTAFADTGDFYRPPYHPAIDNEWLRGKPLTTTQYQKTETGYQPIQTIKNEYVYGGNENNLIQLMFPGHFPSSDDPYLHNRSMHIQPQILFFDQDGILGSEDEDGHNEYITIYNTAGTASLAATTTTNYYDGMQVQQKKTYAYTYDAHYQPSQEVTTMHRGKTTTTTTKYPADVTNKGALGYAELTDAQYSAIQQLQVSGAKHMPSAPIQTETVVKDKDGNVKSTVVQRIVYKAWDTTIVLPEEIQTLKAVQGAAGELEPRIRYIAYDTKGNPLEVAKPNGTSVSYIWGYHQLYPVAKIENATRAQIASATAIAADAHTGAGGLTAAQEQTLRTQLPAALVTTYTYTPLIGITSITDPKGETVTYQYDTLNRLQFVKDTDGNLVSEHRYMYKK